jgi:threonine dehydrogenase-like Zn-dependent dehydrogenase
MNEVRVAVVGVGRIGLTHAETLAHRTQGARLVAVTTSKPERAAAVQRRGGRGEGKRVWRDRCEARTIERGKSALDQERTGMKSYELATLKGKER